jgi:hypothetical protein
MYPKENVPGVFYNVDYQKEWRRPIPSLRNFELEPVKFLSIPGDAPKDFITDTEYRPGHRSHRQRRESYIAKVGSKFYPNESIAEQLNTRIVQSVVHYVGLRHSRDRRR